MEQLQGYYPVRRLCRSIVAATTGGCDKSRRAEPGKITALLRSVESKKADAGQSVSPGSPLATLYVVDYAEVRLPVPLTELEYIDLQLAGQGDDGSVVELFAELGGSHHSWTDPRRKRISRA